jgi:hypothetical protein
VIRLRFGEWLAAAGGVALIVALFLPWDGDASGFESLTVLDIVLVILALPALALAVLQATQDAPAKPVGAAVLTSVAGLLGVLIMVIRLIFDGGRIGTWVAFAATLAMVIGAWRSMTNEKVRGLPPGPEPELRPRPS